MNNTNEKAINKQEDTGMDKNLEKFRNATSIEEVEKILFDTFDKKSLSQMLLPIAETIDEICKTKFNETHPDFLEKYLQEIRRLRVRDALHKQLLELKEVQAFIKKHELYEVQKKCSSEIFKEYKDWKENRTSHRSMDDFVYEKKDLLEKIYVEKYPELENHFTEHDIKKMIRFAKCVEANPTNGNPTNGRHSLVEPTNCPTINYDLLNSSKVYIEYCKKSDAELLAVLGKQVLIRLIGFTCEAIDIENPDKLAIALMMFVCHDVVATTHANGIGTDTSREKDINYNKAGTITPTIYKLEKEYSEAQAKILDFLAEYPQFA